MVAVGNEPLVLLDLVLASAVLEGLDRHFVNVPHVAIVGLVIVGHRLVGERFSFRHLRIPFFRVLPRPRFGEAGRWGFYSQSKYLAQVARRLS